MTVHNKLWRQSVNYSIHLAKQYGFITILISSIFLVLVAMISLYIYGSRLTNQASLTIHRLGEFVDKEKIARQNEKLLQNQAKEQLAEQLVVAEKQQKIFAKLHMLSLLQPLIPEKFTLLTLKEQAQGLLISGLSGSKEQQRSFINQLNRVGIVSELRELAINKETNKALAKAQLMVKILLYDGSRAYDHV